jgi:hypothetical protein
MPTTVAELQNLITGDDANFQAAAKRTQASLESLRALSAQVTAGIATSFSGLGASIGQSLSQPVTAAVSSFNVISGAAQVSSATIQTALQGVSAVANTIPQSINGIATAAQSAGASVASTGSAMAASLTPIGPAALNAGQGLAGLSTAATGAGQGIAGIGAGAAAAGQGLAGLGAGAGNAAISVDALSQRKAELVAQLANVNSALGLEKQALAGAQGALANATTGQTQHAAAVQASQDKLGGYLQEQSLIKGELKNVESALRSATASQGVSATATAAVEEATKKAGGATSFWTNLLSTHTSQISTQGGVLKGYDNVVQAVARSMGGIPVVAALGISVLGVLAEKLLTSTKETEKKIQIDKEAIATYGALARAQLDAVNATTGVTTAFSTQNISSGNLIVALNNIATNQKTVGEQTQLLDKAMDGLGTSTDMAMSATQRYGAVIHLGNETTNEFKSTITEATNSITEHEKAMGPAIQAVKTLQAITGASTEDILKNAEAHKFLGGTALPLVREALEGNMPALQAFIGSLATSTNRTIDMTHAALGLSVALANIRPPTFDVSGTLKGIQNAVQTAEANLAATQIPKIGGMFDFGDRVAVAKRDIDTLNKSIKEYAQIHGKNAAETTRIYKEEVSKLSPEVQKSIGVVAQAAKNAEAFSNAHKRGGATFRSAVSEYKDGVIGLGKAFDGVADALDKGTFSRIFENLPKKMQAAAAETKKQAEEVVRSINDILKREDGGVIKIDDKDIKLTISSLQGLGTEGVKSFKAISETVKDVEEKLNRLAATTISSKPPVIELATQVGLLLNPNTGGFTKAGQDIVDSIHKIGAEVRVVFPATQVEFKNLDKYADDSAEIIQQWGHDWLQAQEAAFKSMQKTGEEAPHWAGAIVDQAERIRKALAGDLPGAAGVASTALLQMRAALDIHSNIDSAISDIERYGEMTHETSAQIAADIDKQFQSWVNAGITTRGELDKILDAHKRAANQLPGIWENIFHNLDSSARKGLNDVFAVINTMPGKWGEALRGTQSQVEKFLSFLDASLKLVQRILGQQETGLKGVVDKIVGVFKGTSSAVTTSLSNWTSGLDQTAGKTIDATNIMGQSTSKMSDGVKTAFGAASMAATGFAASLALTANSSNKALGFIESAITSTIAGITAAMAFSGPVGAIVGGLSLLGGIIGLFKGKSAAQKQQEQLQIKQLQDSIAKDANEIMSGALDNVKKALEIGPLIAEFEGVGKKQIQAVFNFLSRLTTQFIEASKAWNSTNLDQAKKAAERITPVFEVIANVPAAANAVNSTFTVDDAHIANTFTALDKIVDAWEDEADRWLGGPAKRIGKVAEKLAPAINLTAPLTEAIKGINEVEMPTQEKFGIVDSALDTIIGFFNGLADKYAKPVLKAIENLGTKLSPVLSAEKDTIGLIKDTVDLPMPKASDAANLATGMRLFIDSLVASFADFKTDGLATLTAIIIAVTPAFSGVKAWTETAAAVRDYSEVGVGKWQMVADDFATGGQAIHLLQANALAMRDDAALFDATMQDWKTHVTSGFQAYADGMNSAASIASGVLNHLNIPQNPITGGGSLGGESLGASSLFSASSLLPSHSTSQASVGGGATNTTIVNVHLNGNLIHQSRLTDAVVEALVQAQRQGRLATTVV